MAAPLTPSNFWLQQGNQQAYLSWDLQTGATSYSIQRSTDGVTFTTLATPSLNNYLDTSVVVNTQYFYQVASVNGSGTSAYTTAQSCVPTLSGELSLGELRVRSQQKADRLNSNFVTLPEWNFFINQSYLELYDLLITTYEDYAIATPAQFTSNGSTYIYPLPNGVTSFSNGLTNASGYIAPPFYKLRGVDLSIQSANQAYVTVSKFMFEDRNKYVYPNSASTIYGVFNCQYRVMGSNIELIPTPSGNQQFRLWYIPRLPTLLADSDVTSIGISGWLQYVLVRAAKYALDKEESDTSKLDAELVFLKQRIQESAQGRDVGQPDRITDVRGSGWGSYGGGPQGPTGGW
jgi:hypothetical protein